MNNTELLVKEDDCFCLKTFKGKQTVERFNNCPNIKCGLFIVSEDCRRLYTVLGDKIEIPEDSTIINIINFWIIYKIDNHMYISYLDARGMTFELHSYLSIDDYGLLSTKGCTVLINKKWKTYKYDFEFIEDYREVKFDDKDINLNDLIKSGFSLNYIKYLNNNGLLNLNTESIEKINQLQLINEHNKALFDELRSLNTLIKSYSREEIESVMDYPEYLINIFIEYSKFIT